MKRSLCGQIRQPWMLVVSIGFVLTALAAGPALATNSPMAVPYADSFEGYANGATLIGTNGWYSVNPTGATVVAKTYTYPLRHPLDVVSPSNVIRITDDVTNALNHAPGADTNIWIDMMLLPVRSAVQPDVSNDVQLAMYVNSNGNLRVLHSYYEESLRFSRWATLDHPPLPSNEWVRVTLKLDYLTGRMYVENPDWPPVVPPIPYTFQHVDKFFQISINGGEPLTDNYAYSEIPFNFFLPYPTNGSWFLMANSGKGLGDSNINSVAVQGTCMLDDYVVTNGDVFASQETRWLIEATTDEGGTIYPGGNLLIPEGDSVPFKAITDDGATFDALVVDGVTQNTSSWTFATVTTSHTIHASFNTGLTELGVEGSWYSSHGIDPDATGDPQDGEMGDWDSDGALNWEEYVADTIPTDSNSVFTVLGVAGGSFDVTWLAGYTNGGATAAFAILRTTNIMDTNAWMMVTNGLPRDPSGTNTWTDNNPPAPPVFYHPAIPWGN